MDNIKLLLVDDEKGFIDTLTKRLEKRELSVSAVYSGQEALDFLQQDHTIEVVVLDVKMPGMDGIETLKAIKNSYPLVEVVMLTGHATVESAIIEVMKVLEPRGLSYKKKSHFSRDSTLSKADSMNNEKYGVIFRNIAVGIAIFKYDMDKDDFIITELNDAARRIYNIDSEHKAKDWLPGFIDKLSLPVREVHETGKPRIITIKECDGDRLTLWIEHSLFKIPTGEVASVFNDGTEQKLVEENLKKSEQKLRAITHASPLGICLSRDRKIEWVNDTLCKLTGYGRDDIMGKDFRIFYENDAEYDRVGNILYSSFPETELVTVITRWIKQDKSVLDCSIRRSFLEPDHPSAGVVIGVADISSRLKFEKDKARLEELVMHAQKMEAMGILAGGIAHDFNNILFPIMGYAELMMMDTRDDKTLEYLRCIISAVHRSRELIEQILSFSRTKSDAAGPMSLQPLLKETVKLLKASLPSTIKIVQNIHGNCKAVMAEAVHMHQVIMNLCTNAYHAIEEKGGSGILKITLENVELSSEDIRNIYSLEPGAFVMLEVSDTGVGIPPEITKRIFEPYFTTKHPEKGSGIGLSVVHGIVKRYGGEILVESDPDKGTTFRIYFPAAFSDTSGEKTGVDLEMSCNTSPEILLMRGRGRILLIDDEREIVLLINKILTRNGYRVTSCMESPRALTLFQENPYNFDLVLTDLTMPDMNGKELSEKIRSLRQDIPIIMCTGFGDNNLTNGLEARGIVTCILKKPVVIKTLLHIIQEHLSPGE
ncbi:MAG: response regulator [Desulfamplus sp.]|nr:response regulator [Desulfamplus sp.]